MRKRCKKKEGFTLLPMCFVVVSPEGTRLWWTKSDTEAGAIQRYNKDGDFQDEERWSIAEFKGYKVEFVEENSFPKPKWNTDKE